MIEYIKTFWREANDRCKAYIILVLALLLILGGLDVYECKLNKKAEVEIENTANSVFDSLVQEIESMDMQTQEIVEPLKDMVIDIKMQWIRIALLMTYSIIGFLLI